MYRTSAEPLLFHRRFVLHIQDREFVEVGLVRIHRRRRSGAARTLFYSGNFQLKWKIRTRSVYAKESLLRIYLMF